MAVIQVKKYKIIKDKDGNKIKVQKTKAEWDKETRKGTMCWYFSERYEINGKKRQYKSAVFPLRRDAEKDRIIFLANPLEYIAKHSKKARKRISCNTESLKNLNDYFKEFCNYEINYIKESSIHEYKSVWNNHISECLGNLSPYQINLTVIQEWYENINNKTLVRNNKEENYSIETKNKWQSTLSEFLNYLKTKGLIEINYAKAIGQFKNPKKNSNTRKKIKYQTLEEYEKFMNTINNNDFWYVFFNFAFWHGPRIGEQRALKICDINFEKNIIHFHSTFTKSDNGKEIIGPIKNNKERYIDLSEKTKPYLIKLIQFYKNLPGYTNEWFLFGGPIKTTKNSVQRKLNEIYIKLKENNNEIVYLTHHEFGRHSHASYLLNKGMENNIPREVVYEMIAERLGDTVDVIKETYAHPYESKYSEKIKELLKF